MPELSLMMANWKMYKTVAQSRAFVRELLRRMEEAGDPGTAQVICPTAPALYEVARLVSGSTIAIGAQTLDVGREGANTGAISGYLLHEAGAAYVIVGHSERRRLYGDTDAVVSEKTGEALTWGLTAVVCVGESHEERLAGQTDAVVVKQVSTVAQAVNGDLSRVIWAYEPIWAIGTGLVPTVQEANDVAAVIRDTVRQHHPNWTGTPRILYGGSVNRASVGEFAQAPGLDGVLVGGASLDVEHWLELNRQWKAVRS